MVIHTTFPLGRPDGAHRQFPGREPELDDVAPSVTLEDEEEDFGDEDDDFGDEDDDFDDEDDFDDDEDLDDDEDDDDFEDEEEF